MCLSETGIYAALLLCNVDNKILNGVSIGLFIAHDIRVVFV